MIPVANNTKSHTLKILDCGLADFRDILEQQLDLVEKRRLNQISDTILITEHYPVITLGAKKSANKLLVAPETLIKKNIDLVEIRRGGGVTAHNPGQLVLYPVINLKQLNLDINEYIRTLEQIGIELLNEINIKAERKKGFPGLWVGNKKIASLGVRVSKFITCHGMAININNDLSIFDYFVPCGIDNVEITSVLKQTDKRQDMENMKTISAGLLFKYLQKKDAE